MFALKLIAAMIALQSVPEAQLEWQKGRLRVLSVAFRGTWAPKMADCTGNGVEVVTVTATKLWFYEGDSKLLKISGVSHSDSPSGKPAYTLHALVGERELLEVGTGTVRLTLSGGKLYMSRPEAVTEQQQWQYGNIRCPE
jgi:hypothetical protein